MKGSGRRRIRPIPLGGLIAALGTLTVVLFLLALLVGPAPLGVVEVLRAALAEDASTAAIVVQAIRVPRALLALALGITLGLSGAALQGLLRNPLAEPGVIGVSGMAALGAVLAFYWSLAGAGDGGTVLGGGAGGLAVPIAGILGALAGVLLVALLAGPDAPISTLILAGVAVNAFAGALTALALNLAPDPYASFEIYFWLMGSLADRSMAHVLLALPFMVAGWTLLAGTGRGLEALSLGEDVARTLGVDTRRLRWRVVVGAALCVGAGVAVSGVVGFVGLVVPHVLRPWVGHRPGPLLAASALGGAVLVLAADTVIRALAEGPELKLGVVTALIGAPFFVQLVRRTRSEIP